MQAPQRMMPGGTGKAQVWQRGTGWAKRATQASHSGCEGQARQTAHWPGMMALALARSSLNIGSIYSWQATRSLPHLHPIPMPDDRPPTIDPAAAQRWARAAPAASPWLHEEVAQRMEDRLQWIRLAPRAWAHWEPVRGGLKAQELLRRRYPDAECFLIEEQAGRAAAAAKAGVAPWWSPARWTGGGVHAGAPPDAGVQMLWANMALHQSADPQALIARWHRALATDGFLMFSCLGPDSLRELRGLYQALGWPAPGHDFTDMHDWGDMLVHAGFAEPVMDMERIVLTYESPARLLAELRELGRNLHPARFPALRGRQWKKRLEDALVQHLASPADGGRLRLTFEIIYGHALKPAPKVRLAAQSAVSLQDMRAMLRGADGQR